MRNVRDLFVLCGALSMTGPGSARAREESQVEPPRPVRFGATVGVSFPQPLTIEAMIKTGDLFAVGAEYGMLPVGNIDGVHTGLWSLAADARVFPFHGPLFVGLRGGRQHLAVDGDVTVSPYGPTYESAALDTWFLNPRLGFLWTLRGGITLGFDAGVQIPLAWSLTTTVPLGLIPGSHHQANALGSTWLPTVDLLRVGFLY